MPSADAPSAVGGVEAIDFEQVAEDIGQATEDFLEGVGDFFGANDPGPDLVPLASNEDEEEPPEPLYIAPIEEEPAETSQSSLLTIDTTVDRTAAVDAVYELPDFEDTEDADDAP